MKELLIIYYHEVVEDGMGSGYQKIGRAKFEEQMRYLAENGYRSLLFSELANGLPDKAVVISFDDGFRTVFDRAAPILRHYRLKANVYLPTRYIGADSHFMSWDMVEQLCSDGSFEMQAHTHSHVDIRTLSQDAMRDEVDRSNRLIEQHLGCTPTAFCMPYGAFDRPSIRRLRACSDYRYLLGSFYGRRPEHKLSSCILPRIGISDDDPPERFAQKLAGDFDWKGPLQRLRLVAKNLKKERITEYEY